MAGAAMAASPYLPNQVAGGPQVPMRVLIVRLSAMGDVLHALPAVTALRQENPGCWIGWAIDPAWAPLLRAKSWTENERGMGMPVVDQIHLVPTKKWRRHLLRWATYKDIGRVSAELRGGKYDLCIDLQGAVRSAVIGLMAGARRLVGEDAPREKIARWLFTEHIETEGAHVIEHGLELVEGATEVCLGDLPPEAIMPWLPLDTDAEAWADGVLAGVERFVLMTPGAGWGAKRWPPERFGQVAAGLKAMGFETLVNAGPKEAKLADAVERESAGAARRVDSDLGQLISLTRRAAFVVGGDTGPLHLAAALRIPVIGIYGPTDPARNGPFGTNQRVLRSAESRKDHSRRSTPEAGLMTITVEQVLAAAEDLMTEVPWIRG